MKYPEKWKKSTLDYGRKSLQIDQNILLHEPITASNHHIPHRNISALSQDFRTTVTKDNQIIN
jgi:hypothetical protein